VPRPKSNNELIRELHELRDKLAYLEGRYRDLFQQAPVMYVITRNEAGAPLVEDCNELFLKTLVLAREEAVGRPLSDFYTESSRRRLEGGGYRQALRGDFATQERRLVTRGGEIVDTLLHALPFTDPNGVVIGTRAMFVDITERKRAEEAVRRSEEKYRSLFEESQDAIFISTPEGRLLDINRAGVELFGYGSKDELMTVEIGRDLYRDAGERRRLMAILAERGSVRDFELKLRRKDGSKLTARESAAAVRDETGRIVAYRGILRDVTEQRELEEQLRKAQRMEAVGQLAGGVAHDFNNLLTAIIGYAELGLKSCPPESAHCRSFNEIVAAGEKAAALTRQLLAFARRQVLQPKVLDLNAAVASIHQLLRRTIGEHVELATELDPELGRVKADPGQIEQVLMNLAINARDAMPDGGRLTIRTANARLDPATARGPGKVAPGPYVLLTVSDTGCGMDEPTQSRIFEPFFSTKEPGKGTGLGLSTAYGIVKQSGGYIWTESQVGKGTTFAIYLPRVEHPVEAAQPARPATTGGGCETILVVEDEQVVRDLTTQVLRGLGYRVMATPDAEEALRILDAADSNGAVDLLLTDLVLRGMSGLDLARRVAASRPRVKVLAMSGYTDEAVLRRDPLSAALSFIAKPFSPGALARKVRDVLDAAPEPSPQTR
jgi:PAS domain S-box-containing protein